MVYRDGEEISVRFRTQRCFRVGTDWYIATREKRDIGPFSSRETAEKAIPRYIKILNDAQKSDLFARKIALDGIWATTYFS